jgi:hypothetical protein
MAKLADIDTAAERVEALLSAFTETADRNARTKAEELVRVVMELYGAGLANIMNIVRQSGGGAEALLDHLAEDKLVASLLLVHGLHPVDAETRIRHALARIEQELDGYRLVFEGLAKGTAKVRVEPANGTGRAGAGAALAARIEQALRETAPDVERFEIEGVPDPHALVQNTTPQRQ